MGLSWKENKRFIAIVASGFLISYIYYSSVIGGLNESTAAIRKERKSEEGKLRDLLAGGRPDPASLHRAGTDVKHARASLAGMVQDFSFEMPKEFVPPSDTDPQTHFDTMAARVEEDLKERAVRSEVIPPKTLGFDKIPADYSEEYAQELLERLALVDRVTRVIMRSAGPEGGKIEELDPLGGADPLQGAVPRKGLFLSPLSIRVKFTAESKCVFQVLHDVQRRGRFLAVSWFDAVQPDVTRDLLTAEIVVSALRITANGALQSAPEAEEEDW